MGISDYFPNFRHPVQLIKSIDETNGILFGVYFAYFLAVPLLTWLLDRKALCDKTMRRLGEIGNRKFAQFKKIVIQRSNASILDAVDSDDSDLEEGMGSAKAHSQQTSPAQIAPAPLPKDTKVVRIHRLSRLDRAKADNMSFISRVFGRSDRDRYLDGFWKNIMNGVAYAGITGDLSRSSFCKLCTCCGCCSKSSYYNDFYFYLSNNHQVVSMFAACPGHPFTRNHRRMAYILQQSIAFVLATIAASLAYQDKEFTLKNPATGKPVMYKLTAANQSQLLNMLVISPFVLFTYTSIYTLMTCPCLKHDCTSCCLRFFKKLLERGGSFLGSVLCVFVTLVLLFIISLWPVSSSEIYKGLIDYTLQVQLFSFALDTLSNFSVFWPLFYVEITLCDLLRVLRVGGWIGERRLSRSLQFGSKPAKRYRLLRGLITVRAAWWHAPVEAIAPAPAADPAKDMEEGHSGRRSAVQQRAAVVLQCAYRAYFSRRLVALLRQLLAEHTVMYMEAILVLQRCTRGMLVRRALQRNRDAQQAEELLRQEQEADAAARRNAFKRKHREKHSKAEQASPPAAEASASNHSATAGAHDRTELLSAVKAVAAALVEKLLHEAEDKMVPHELQRSKTILKHHASPHESQQRVPAGETPHDDGDGAVEEAPSEVEFEVERHKRKHRNRHEHVLIDTPAEPTLRHAASALPEEPRPAAAV